MYGTKREKAGCYRHPSGWVLLRTEEHGQRENKIAWEAVDDVNPYGPVISGDVFENTLREAVADLERRLAEGLIAPLWPEGNNKTEAESHAR